jgi:hypothetical protein
MTDRYTKIILTIIAGALIYLCIVMTPLPAAHAQSSSLRPGDISTEPLPVVITGWQAAGQAMPVTFQRPVPVTVNNDVRVITERSSGTADRVVLVGWEQNASRERPSPPASFNGLRSQIGTNGLPVTPQPQPQQR